MAIFEAVLRALKVGFLVNNGTGDHLSTCGSNVTVFMASNMLGTDACLVMQVVFVVDQSLHANTESNADGDPCGLRLGHMVMLVLVDLLEDF